MDTSRYIEYMSVRAHDGRGKKCPCFWETCQVVKQTNRLSLDLPVATNLNLLCFLKHNRHNYDINKSANCDNSKKSPLPGSQESLK